MGIRISDRNAGKFWWLVCKPCRWALDTPNTACRPECPHCGLGLAIVCGAEDEVREHVAEILGERQ
jgi:hypothetical protein